MKLFYLSFAAFAAAIQLGGAVSQAAPVQFVGNGNYYELITQKANWATAKANAAAMTFSGMQGHLVTITSAAENAFVATQLGDIGRAWTAGTDSVVEGEFRWDAGPEAGQQFWTGGTGGSAIGYANFSGSEPNNLAGTEHYVEIFYFGGDWNDQEGTDVSNYIVEYEAVPEPAAAGMVILSGLGLLFARKRS